MAFFSSIRAPAWLRLPRPKTFLGFIPLRMGTELIVLTLVFNKLTGLYGLLAILTGFSLSATQLSAYFYNVAVLVTLAVCIPHIRRETPLPNLVLAWLYVFDTVANAAYTAVFATGWYLAVKAGKYGAIPSAAASIVSSATSTLAVVPETAMASVTSTVARRDEDALTTAVTSLVAATSEAVTATTTMASSSAASATTTSMSLAGSGGWMGAHEAGASLTVVVIVTTMRIYFSLVVMSYARRSLQKYSESMADKAPVIDDGGDNSTDEDKGDEGSGSARSDVGDADIDDEEAGLKSGTRSARSRRSRRRAYGRRHNKASSGSGSGNNPFAQGSPAGEGWKGRIGRALVAVGRGYWLNRERDDNWARDDFGAKLRAP